MLPTPVLSVSGKGFARLRVSAWHFSPAPPILYAVRAIVYHKSRVLSRVLRDFSGAKPPEPPGLNPSGTGYPCRGGVRRGLNPSGTCCPCHCGALRGACLACRLLPPAFTFFSAPYPPAPFPGGEGGAPKFISPGLRPRHPCIRPFAALTVSAKRAPCARSLRLPAKTTGSGSL